MRFRNRESFITEAMKCTVTLCVLREREERWSKGEDEVEGEEQCEAEGEEESQEENEEDNHSEGNGYGKGE